MKIFRIVLQDISFLPVVVKEFLAALVAEEELGIKGGLARLVLLEYLKKGGKEISDFRLRIEREIKDIDFILMHGKIGRLKESKDYLLSREKKSRKKSVPYLKNIMFLLMAEILSLLMPVYQIRTRL